MLKAYRENDRTQSSIVLTITVCSSRHILVVPRIPSLARLSDLTILARLSDTPIRADTRAIIFSAVNSFI